MATPAIPKDFFKSNFPRPVKTYHRSPYARLDPSKSGFKGAGKTIVVTGGATGIGFEISRAFADTGVSRICILPRRPEPLAKAKQALENEFAGLKVDTYPVSVDDCAAINNVIQQIGHIDVLVMSAAAAAAHSPLVEASLDSVESAYQVNVVGDWNLVKAALNVRTNKSKQIIILNVSTLSAYRPLPGQAVYGSSKGAFTQLMTEFAGEHDESEARFVSYHHGAVYTELASQNFSKGVFEGWEDVALPGQCAVWLTASGLANQLSWMEAYLCVLIGGLHQGFGTFADIIHLVFQGC